MERVQLLSLSAICLLGIGVLAARRRHAGRPLRRPVALLIDSFALGLVMIAVLFVFGTLEAPAFQPIQRATLVVIGISPIAFLIGLLDARLARSGVDEPARASCARTRRLRASRTHSRGRCAIRRSRSPTGCPSSRAGPTSTAGA